MTAACCLPVSPTDLRSCLANSRKGRHGIGAQGFETAVGHQAVDAAYQIVIGEGVGADIVGLSGHGEIGFFIDEHNQQTRIGVAQIGEDFEDSFKAVVEDEQVDMLVAIRDQFEGVGNIRHQLDAKFGLGRINSGNNGWRVLDAR